MKICIRRRDVEDECRPWPVLAGWHMRPAVGVLVL